MTFPYIEKYVNQCFSKIVCLLDLRKTSASQGFLSGLVLSALVKQLNLHILRPLNSSTGLQGLVWSGAGYRRLGTKMVLPKQCER
jgi:hypothetical protein